MNLTFYWFFGFNISIKFQVTIELAFSSPTLF